MYIAPRDIVAPWQLAGMGTLIATLPLLPTAGMTFTLSLTAKCHYLVLPFQKPVVPPDAPGPNLWSASPLKDRLPCHGLEVDVPSVPRGVYRQLVDFLAS